MFVWVFVGQGIGGYHFLVHRRTPDPDPVLAGDRHGSHVLMTIQISDVITGRNHIKEGFVERLFDKQPDH